MIPAYQSEQRGNMVHRQPLPLLFLAAATATANAVAAPGRTPVTDPGFIAAPGGYVLAHDIATADATTLRITAWAGDIDLNLAGHTITGPPGWHALDLRGQHNITLRN